MRGVALGGFMGTGKTTVGRALSVALGLPFVDMDAILAERHGPIARQFAEDGEAAFRARESALIAELDDGTPRVIATGGGAWVDPVNRSTLGRHALRVVLRASVETLRVRVGDAPERPLWGEGLEALLEARSEAYADSDLGIDTDEASASEVVDAILQALGPATDPHVVPVELGDRSYAVHVVPDRFAGLSEALDAAGVGADVAVVADRESARHHGEALRAELGNRRVLQWVEPAHGEANKTVDTWRGLLDALLVPGFHRKTAVLALGGGVAGDLAGFAAATAMRGVPFVQIPTTLLAMVDSSVGGKTGVNHPRGKNLVGAFHQPRMVWAGMATLDTLPREELACGLVEALKTGLIADPDLVDRIERHAALLGAGGARDVLAEVVARCVALKARIVEADEREAGQRALLNLGHTLAHGLEAVLGGDRISHGHAVAIGLVHEARWAVVNGVCTDPDLPDRVASILGRIGVDTALPVTLRDGVVAAMRLDKKASSDTLSLPVPVRSGSATLVELAIERLGELLPDESP